MFLGKVFGIHTMIISGSMMSPSKYLPFSIGLLELMKSDANGMKYLLIYPNFEVI